MAKNLAPNHWLPSWSEDGTAITVPIASFPELTAGEADGATGDIRKVVFAICEKLKAAFDGEAVADRPNKMTISGSRSLNAQTGAITANYSITLQLTPGVIEVSAES